MSIQIFRKIRRTFGGKVVEEKTEQYELTPEMIAAEKARLEAVARKAWPEGAPRISGCCDRADQA